MKIRIALSLAALGLVSVIASAQEALHLRPDVFSPQINDDLTVTFRLNAPKAQEVLLEGDFPGGNSQQMHKDASGVWTLTTAEPLPGELYSYAFRVDSLRITDPANVYTMRDISTLFSLLLIEEGGSKDYAIGDVPHGSLTKTWYHSDSEGVDRRLTVYTPAGYEQSGDLRYPVLYLLHGMGGDENAWAELGRASQILDNMIARGEVEPMIVVMPNGNIDLQSAPGESKDGMYVPTTKLPRTMDGHFEAAFPEIVSHVDRTYRTKTDKASRAIAGLSMGGMHSMVISREYPEMFDYVGLFSAAVRPIYATRHEVYRDDEKKLRKQFENAPKLYWIAIGEDDFLYGENVAFREALDKAGYPYEYFESAGGHQWRNWRAYLRLFLPRLFR